MKKNHYTYRITNILEKKHYYGTRSCNILPINDLGIKYFSSSKDKEFILDQKENKENYKYKIIKIFKTRKEAILLEIKLHNKFDVGKNNYFFNRAKQTSTGFDTTGIFLKNNPFRNLDTKGEKNPFYGKKHSEKTKEYFSSIRKGTRLGIENTFYGRTHSEKSKKKISTNGWKGEEGIERRRKISEASKNLKRNNYKIYNQEKKLMYNFDGGFKTFCKENNLPVQVLRESYLNNGKPIYTSLKSHPKNGMEVYKGWYALKKKN